MINNMVKNIVLQLRKIPKKEKNQKSYVSYKELEKMYVNDDLMDYSISEYNEEGYMSWLMFLKEEYNEYTKKQLVHICGYYDITVRKKNKDTIINDILSFEVDETNDEIVRKRRLLWNYMEELKNDKYLKKYIILD